MDYWPEGDVDGLELQDLAEYYAVIVKVPGGYDPEKHGEDFADYVDPVDKWYLRNYDEEAER